MSRVLLWLTVALLLAAPAGAQSIGTVSGQDYWGNVGGGGAVLIDAGRLFELSPTVLARVNVTSHLSAEVALDLLSVSRRYGLYTLQAHLRPGPLDRRLSPFVVFGVVGIFESRRVRELRRTFPADS